MGFKWLFQTLPKASALLTRKLHEAEGVGSERR